MTSKQELAQQIDRLDAVAERQMNTISQLMTDVKSLESDVAALKKQNPAPDLLADKVRNLEYTLAHARNALGAIEAELVAAKFAGVPPASSLRIEKSIRLARKHREEADKVLGDKR